MTALSANLARRRMSATNVVVALMLAAPVAAATHIYEGGAVALNTSGHLVPASADSSLRVVGVAEAEADNSAGSAGDLTVVPRRGAFPFDNSSGTAAVTAADIGRPCYVVDDNTVARHSNMGARPVMGIVVGVEDSKVFVEVGIRGDASDDNDVMVLAGADLSAKRHLPVKLNSSGAAVAATTAGEAPYGILQNAPGNGAVAIVRIAGHSDIILGATLAPQAQLAVQATTGRAKAANGGTVSGGAGDPADDHVDGSYVFGLCTVGGDDGDTGRCLITHAGVIPSTFT